MAERKYKHTLSELIDRLSILQIKEVKISEHKAEYAGEIADIIHDINLILHEEEIWINGDMLRDIVVLAQYNLHIWINEAEARKGSMENCNLFLSHGLNSIRNNAKNRIQSIIGGRKDYKLDNVEAFQEWIPSTYGKD